MRDLFLSSHIRAQKLFDLAVQDPFFAPIVHDLIDYGADIRFSVFGGAGAYKPYALRTEPLDTPEKLERFYHGISPMFGAGQLKARITLPRFASQGVVEHSFLHEVMHFYQDMHGLYFVPLEEEGVFPIILDAKSSVMATLFNEAWAQVESIRASYGIARKHEKDSLWAGAIGHRDFGAMAQRYAEDLDAGVSEARAAATIFMVWYEGRHRGFYEKHALQIYNQNFKRYEEQALFHDDFLRTLELPMLIARLPQGHVPRYFDHLDWADKAFEPQIDLKDYAVSEHPNVQNIKCGAPPYLWNRLRQAGELDLRL